MDDKPKIIISDNQIKISDPSEIRTTASTTSMNLNNNNNNNNNNSLPSPLSSLPSSIETSPTRSKKHPAISNDNQLISQKEKLKSPFDNQKLLEHLLQQSQIENTNSILKQSNNNNSSSINSNKKKEKKSYIDYDVDFYEDEEDEDFNIYYDNDSINNNNNNKNISNNNNSNSNNEDPFINQKKIVSNYIKESPKLAESSDDNNNNNNSNSNNSNNKLNIKNSGNQYMVINTLDFYNNNYDYENDYENEDFDIKYDNLFPNLSNSQKPTTTTTTTTTTTIASTIPKQQPPIDNGTGLNNNSNKISNNNEEEEELNEEFEVEDEIEEKVTAISQTLQFVSDIIESLQNAFEEGDVWRNDSENESFLTNSYSDFVTSKDELLELIKIYGSKAQLIKLLSETVSIETRFESLKKQLEYYKSKNEQFNETRLQQLQQEYSGVNNGADRKQSKTINQKFKKVYNIFKNKFDNNNENNNNVNNSQNNSNSNSNNQEQQPEDDEDDEKKYQQNFEILPVDSSVIGSGSGSSSDSNTSECQICLLDVEYDKLFLISQCGHIYCTECLSEYLKTNILSRKVYIPCPYPKCSTWFQYGQIKYLVDDHTFTKYEEFTFSTFLMKSPNYKWCPNKNCENAVYGEVDNPRTRCSNKECNFDFCFNCESEWHHNSTCEQYQIWRLENTMVDTTYGQWTKTNDTKKCPKCKSVIEKNAGCNHITCHCGYNFCWLCGGKYSNNHFNTLNVFGCPGMASKKLSSTRRISQKGLIGVAVVLGGVVVVGVGIPTIIVGLPIYGGYIAQKHIRRKLKK